MLRARPIVPLAAGIVAGIALALLPGAWIPPAAAGALAAALSIRWRQPALLLIRVSATEGCSSPKVPEALPFSPRPAAKAPARSS